MELNANNIRSSFGRNPTRNVWDRISRDDPSVTSLQIIFVADEVDVDDIVHDSDIIDLGRDIGSNTSLTTLCINGSGRLEITDLSRKKISESGYCRREDNRKLKLICEGINANRSIQELDIYGLAGLKVFLMLNTFLSKNPSLDSLFVESHKGLNSECIEKLLAPLLKSQVNHVTCLDLVCNNMSDEAAMEAFSTFRQHPHKCPSEIDMSGNDIGEKGLRAMTELLQSPACNVEKLNIAMNPKLSNDAHVVATMARALRCNETLAELIVTCSSHVLDKQWDPVRVLLCDKSSVSATYSSNHVLHTIGDVVTRHALPNDIKESLELNRNDDKEFVAAEKVRRVFQKDGTDIMKLLGLEARKGCAVRKKVRGVFFQEGELVSPE